MVSRIWAVCSVILNAVSLAQAQVQSEGQNATICNVTVSLSSEWGLQGETFNASLAVSGVTRATQLRLAPSWDKLNISRTEFSAARDAEYALTMAASQFYLYRLTVSCEAEDGDIADSVVMEVPVGRTQTENLIAVIFQRLMSVFLAFAMLLMGCELKFAVVRGYLRRPLAPFAGMVCQYGFMPAMAFLIGLALMPDNTMARYGLILIGSSPGGSFSNFWTAMWGGDLDLSVTMTFCSTVASFATTTFWVWLFGRFVLRTRRSISLPYLQLFISLVALVAPILLGLLITWRRPHWSARLVKLSRPFFLFMILVVLTLGIYTNRFFFAGVSWYDLVAGACLGFSGYCVGILFSLLLCLNRQQVIALSLETAIQNAGIAIVILQTNLPSPYGDMALMPVIGYLFTSVGPLNLAMYSLYRIVRAIRACGHKDEEQAEKREISMKDRHNAGFTPE